MLIMAVLILLVSAKYFFPQRFVDFALLFATNKYLLLKGKNPKITHPFNVMLFLVNIISVSLFVFIFFDTLNLGFSDKPQILFLKIAMTYVILILSKVVLEKIIASILSLNKKLNFYLFYKLSYRNFMALALLPVSIAFIYIWKPGLIALYSLAGLLLLMNFVIVAAFFKKNQQYLLNHLFYFILYLCALEIGPYYILYKLITKNYG